MYSVVFENNEFLIVNKASGVLVHKTKYEGEANLIDAINSERRVNYFLTHRIDKFTSGIVIIAKNKSVLNLTLNLFFNGKIEKTYLAIVSKELPAKQVKISLSIGRNKGNKLMFSNRNAKNYKPAITEVKEIYKKFIEAHPLTGRTHQIRTHLSNIGCPVFNDPVYNSEVFDLEFGQYLHAYKIKFLCPVTGDKIEAIAKLPEKFLSKLKDMNIDTSVYE